MNERPPRKRIPLYKTGAAVAIDELEFKKNKCSDKAKIITTIVESIDITLWFDKHYHDRHQLGDDNGKRDGIGPEVVEELVKKTLKHLLLYSSVIKGFKFINFDGSADPSVRVVLQEQLGNTLLNVVIETHFLEINKYEITVKTALCADDFRIGTGQYAIEIQGDTSILKRCDNKKIVDICSF